MRPLHPIDFIFLSLEKRQQPMHVGGLFLFQIPENAPASFIQNLVADIRNSKSIPIPPFNNKLNGLFWDEDEEFDLDHHFRHIALPQPGRILELLTYISQEHSSLIDRANRYGPVILLKGLKGIVLPCTSKFTMRWWMVLRVCVWWKNHYHKIQMQRVLYHLGV